jgi:hypothetical protein
VSENLSPVSAENKSSTFVIMDYYNSVFTRLFNSSIVKKFLWVSACLIGSTLAFRVGLQITILYKPVSNAALSLLTI